MTAVIILAAGRSGRLGKPKQNVIFQGKTLLQHAIDTALATMGTPVIVVLGGNEALISVEEHPDVKVIFNTDWENGIASSIRIGIEEILADETITDAVIMLCDQPYVTVDLINTLILSRQQSNKNIVACRYKNTLGVPALFNRNLFDKLLLLTGDEGAKKVIINHPDNVAEIPFELGGIDIDTPEDLKQLHQSPGDL